MPKKLLLADDSITIQKVVSITLANEDLEIVSVDNGEDAIARARAIRPDMVLADASMPKKDGYQVAEALKNDPATAMIPVLILAGQLEGHPDQARLAACKADGFIPKPFESAVLIDRVRKTLGLTAPAMAKPAVPATTASAVAAPPRPAAGTPVAAPRPVPPPVVAAAPVAPPRPAPAPMPAPIAAAPLTVPAIDETDFGDLSAQPAASGDQDLWGGEAPLAPGGIAADDAMWSQEDPAETTPNPNSAPLMTFEHPETTASDPSPFVMNPAEMANLEKFSVDDAAPSGLDLDESVPRQAPKRSGDENLKHTSELIATDLPPMAAPSAADIAAAISPEKLEAIVREVVAKMIGPILEKIAWEVVPDLAEDIIKDELKRLTGGSVSGSQKSGAA